MFDSHLIFDSNIGQRKRSETIEGNPACPFCAPDTLENIIDAEDSIILVENKYAVLRGTYQTVLIETDKCDSELSLYDKDHLHSVFQFGFQHWMKMAKGGQFASVLFFKNHGPFSGGTIRHPHMQIVGLENYDYSSRLCDQYFEGITIDQNFGVTFTLSTKPMVGFFEFNVIMEGSKNIETFANYVQTGVHFVLNHYHSNCTSYNIFFYEWKEKIIAKIMPRFVTSPLYVGYGIPQTSTKIEELASKVKDTYF